MAEDERATAIPTAAAVPDGPSPDAADDALAARAEREGRTGRLLAETRLLAGFLLKLVVVVLLLRTLVFSPFSIPSESMLPRLLIGDYLFISKWNYGYSRYSVPFDLPLGAGRLFGKLPERGDVVVFKAPPTAEKDWVKRVIGLPGDTIQVRGGQVILNGVAVPKQQVADFIVPVSANYRCEPPFLDTDATNAAVCRYPQFRETLPNGRTYAVLDQGDGSPGDDTGVYAVPPGHVFLMGDNRDDSLDSRFTTARGGIGYVPLDNLEGKAQVGFWSTDGGSVWYEPWTWFAAARWSRIGEGF